MSFEFKPPTAELIKVKASPEDKASELTSATSSKITPSTTQSGLELP